MENKVAASSYSVVDGRTWLVGEYQAFGCREGVRLVYKSLIGIRVGVALF